jgi:hypothetical protein
MRPVVVNKVQSLKKFSRLCGRLFCIFSFSFVFAANINADNIPGNRAEVDAGHAIANFPASVKEQTKGAMPGAMKEQIADLPKESVPPVTPATPLPAAIPNSASKDPATLNSTAGSPESINSKKSDMTRSLPAKNPVGEAIVNKIPGSVEFTVPKKEIDEKSVAPTKATAKVEELKSDKLPVNKNVTIDKEHLNDKNVGKVLDKAVNVTDVPIAHSVSKDNQGGFNLKETVDKGVVGHAAFQKAKAQDPSNSTDQKTKVNTNTQAKEKALADKKAKAEADKLAKQQALAEKHAEAKALSEQKAKERADKKAKAIADKLAKEKAKADAKAKQLAAKEAKEKNHVPIPTVITSPATIPSVTTSPTSTSPVAKNYGGTASTSLSSTPNNTATPLAINATLEKAPLFNDKNTIAPIISDLGIFKAEDSAAIKNTAVCSVQVGSPQAIDGLTLNRNKSCEIEKSTGIGLKGNSSCQCMTRNKSSLISFSSPVR